MWQSDLADQPWDWKPQDSSEKPLQQNGKLLPETFWLPDASVLLSYISMILRRHVGA